MCKLFYFVLFASFVCVDVSPETRVHNAKALSPNGKYDFNIQVIQVRIITPASEFDSPSPTTTPTQIDEENSPTARNSKEHPAKIHVNGEPRAQITQYSANQMRSNTSNSDAAESFVFLLLACSLGIVLVLSMTYMILTVRGYRKKPKLARSFSVIYHHHPTDLEEFYYHTRTPIYKKPIRSLPPVTGPPPELPPRLNRPKASHKHMDPLLPKSSKLEEEEHRRMLSLNKNYLNQPRPRARTYSF
uniref:Uncharacterized protein n=2 Tax=Acrobeloides nanus TaxID=290746 RepID=A0A914E880_9BILA